MLTLLPAGPAGRCCRGLWVRMGIVTTEDGHPAIFDEGLLARAPAIRSRRGSGKHVS
jgi:hypothetical protein